MFAGCHKYVRHHISKIFVISGINVGFNYRQLLTIILLSVTLFLYTDFISTGKKKLIQGQLIQNVNSSELNERQGVDFVERNNQFQQFGARLSNLNQQRRRFINDKCWSFNLTERFEF